MQFSFPTAVVLATLFGSIAASPVQSSRVQTTTGGIIIGHGASNKTSVTEFLGVRYAEAPVGKLRFAAPKRYLAPYGSVFEASEWVRTQLSTRQQRTFANESSQRMFILEDCTFIVLILH